jgi:hypothetical protein
MDASTADCPFNNLCSLLKRFNTIADEWLDQWFPNIVLSLTSSNIQPPAAL